MAQRLDQCPLYDPALDLAIETTNRRVAGYSLFWFDPITKVGLVEPVRVEEEFWRQGLARAMLSEGIDRLVTRGKPAGQDLLRDRRRRRPVPRCRFRPTSTATIGRYPIRESPARK
ncbi:MAG: GNAT family N-acetyltransferase [Acidimicrobiia bacterium]